MKMKEVCERTGLTERTVRFYMQKGLIAPKGEWRNGREYSEFAEADVEMLEAIATLRELSFSIDDILTMQRTPGAIPAIVQARREAVREQHEVAENAYTVLGKLDTDGISDVATLAARARAAAAYRPHPTPPPRPAEVNTSGMGERCNYVPYEIKEKWNWGAFLFSVIWGLCNKTYQALLCFIPIIGFFVPFWLGSHGNELAWKNKYWMDVDEFRRVQRKWAIWSICITVAILSLYIGLLIANQHAIKNEKILHAERLTVMESQLFDSPEWAEVMGSRTLWMQREHPMPDDVLALSPSDLMYFSEDAYYRIVYSDYYDMGAGTDARMLPDGSLVFDGENGAQLVYECTVELSNTERWNFRCLALASGEIVAIHPEFDAAATETIRAQVAATLRAEEDMRAYVDTRTAEITASALWAEKIGPNYEFDGTPQPGYVYYDDVYAGGNVVCGGYDAYVRASGTQYHVYIYAQYDEAANAEVEGELRIEPVAEQ